MYKTYKTLCKVCNFIAYHPICSICIGAVAAVPISGLWALVSIVTH